MKNESLTFFEVFKVGVDLINLPYRVAIFFCVIFLYCSCNARGDYISFIFFNISGDKKIRLNNSSVA